MTSATRPSPTFHAARRAALLTPLLLSPALASAHVKWFAPYIVEAPPQRIGSTLADPWFWTGIALVLVFFLVTRAVEKTAFGAGVLGALDKVTGPLWSRRDDFMRFVIAAFFVAVFAVGGVFLTPDLRTPYEWVSWLQLLIAALVFSRRTMPLAAAGILLLWLLALRQYEFFHLLDYLSLGVAVAAYLVMESSDRPRWREYRFVVLRWGVAIALMWSSLEKFAYPDWFYPLVEEKPFLTFGMPRDVFIPMAGVAEFTMGFGLLWTALVRRLSAIALFVIFNLAVYPFGRMDLVGHALIMAVIVIIAADPTPQKRFAIRRNLASIPAALVASLALFATSYWGLHLLLYGPDGQSGIASDHPPARHRTTHMPDPERPHATMPPAALQAHGAAPAAGGATARQEYLASMQRMHEAMEAGVQAAQPDEAFVRGMIAHHQAAIEMAQIQLRHGTDPQNSRFAREIIATQAREIEQMQEWLRSRNLEGP